MAKKQTECQGKGIFQEIRYKRKPRYVNQVRKRLLRMRQRQIINLFWKTEKPKRLPRFFCLCFFISALRYRQATRLQIKNKAPRLRCFSFFFYYKVRFISFSFSSRLNSSIFPFVTRKSCFPSAKIYLSDFMLSL